MLAAKQNESSEDAASQDLDDVIKAINAAIPSDTVIKALEVINDAELKEKIKETVGELLTEKEIESVVNLRNKSKEPRIDPSTTPLTTAQEPLIPSVLNDRVKEPQVLNERVPDEDLSLAIIDGLDLYPTKPSITTKITYNQNVEETTLPAYEYYEESTANPYDVIYDESDYETAEGSTVESIIGTIIGDTVISNDIDNRVDGIIVEATVEDLPDGADGVEGQVFIDYSQSEDEEVQNIIQVSHFFIN